MDNNTASLILSELRDLRSSFNIHASETGERLATLESQMYGICGNGRPGRIANLEEAVKQLERWRWWLVGVAAGGSSVVSVIAWFLTASHAR